MPFLTVATAYARAVWDILVRARRTLCGFSSLLEHFRCFAFTLPHCWNLCESLYHAVVLVVPSGDNARCHPFCRIAFASLFVNVIRVILPPGKRFCVRILNKRVLPYAALAQACVTACPTPP